MGSLTRAVSIEPVPQQKIAVLLAVICALAFLSTPNPNPFSNFPNKPPHRTNPLALITSILKAVTSQNGLFMTIDNLMYSVQDTNGANSLIEGSVINTKHQIGAHEGFSLFTTNSIAEDARGPLGPEFSTQQLRINTIVDAQNLYIDSRPTNSVSTFTAYLSCMDQNFDGGVAFPRLQLSFITRDTNTNYEIAINIPATNTVSGVGYLANFMLSATGTNLFLPQINVRDASLNAYKSITGDNVGYYGTVNATPVPVLPPYETWRRSWFTQSQLDDPSISGDFANPAHDGIVNLLKYALALCPTNATVNGLPTAVISTNNYLTLTYRKNKQATDIAYVVQACGTLIPNSWSTNGLVVISQADSNTYWRVTVRDAVPIASATNRFMRLKITKP
jgi:hypothetical protein